VAPDGRILVVPVNYGLDGRTVVLRTGDTDLLAVARARSRVAFQVEDIEPGLRSGWTVLVDGTLDEVDDEDLAERLARLVDPWRGCASRAPSSWCSSRSGRAGAASTRSAASRSSSWTGAELDRGLSGPQLAADPPGVRPGGRAATGR
jgi:hypothetical protein